MHANHIIIVILHEYVLAQGGTGQELGGSTRPERER